MPDPTPYEPGYDFTASDKGVQLNVELADVAEATEQLVLALQDVRRSDGALKNGIVTADSLAPSALAALGPNGDLTAETLAAAQAAAATATTQAGIATTQATAASTSAGTATTQASTATTQAGIATTKAAEAAASAAAAGAAKIAFLAYLNNADQTGIVTETATKVEADTIIFDEGEYYDIALSRWTPPAGRYRITASAMFTAAVVDGSQYRAMLYVNGELVRQSVVTASGTAALSVSVTAMLEFSGTGYVEFFVRGDGTGDKTISGARANTWFEGSAL